MLTAAGRLAPGRRLGRPARRGFRRVLGLGPVRWPVWQ
jgi:hypothetical protein